jgi:hypothetical protein
MAAAIAGGEGTSALPARMRRLHETPGHRAHKASPGQVISASQFAAASDMA